MLSIQESKLLLTLLTHRSITDSYAVKIIKCEPPELETIICSLMCDSNIFVETTNALDMTDSEQIKPKVILTIDTKEAVKASQALQTQIEDYLTHEDPLNEFLDAEPTILTTCNEIDY